MKKFAMLILLGVLTWSLAGAVAPAVGEALEFAIKRSGRTLAPAWRRSVSAELARAAAAHGDDLLRSVRTGGIEVAECGVKYGDDFWRIAARHPEVARNFALHADELMPAVRRIGPDFVELEVRAPGLGVRAIELFGDNSAAVLKTIPAEDLARLLGYAGRTGNPATRKLLFDCYQSSPDRTLFLEKLNWKQIMAGGLSTGAIVAAYKISGGIEAGLVEAARNSPETFAEAVTSLVRPFQYAIIALAVLILYPLLKLSFFLADKIKRK